MTIDDVEPFVRKKVVWGSRSASLDIDIRCAAVSQGGVLITGPPAQAEAIAMEIHRRGGAKQRPFEVVDCGDPDCLRVLDRGDQPGGATVLLKDVGLLTPPLQARLLEQLTDRRLRIMASSLESPRARLDPTLFYRLNIVHIDLASGS